MSSRGSEVGEGENTKEKKNKYNNYGGENTRNKLCRQMGEQTN